MNIRPYLLRCTHCGAKNRIPPEKVGATAKCGKCHSDIDTKILKIGEPVVVTDRTFENVVLKSPLPVLLDCWAPWCGACQIVSPTVAEIARELRGRIRVAKINTDQNPITASRYEILSLPTLLVFDRGVRKDTMAGAFPKLHILQRIRPYVM